MQKFLLCQEAIPRVAAIVQPLNRQSYWSAPMTNPLQDHSPPPSGATRKAKGVFERLRRRPRGRLHPSARQAQQMRETAARHFAGQDGLVLVDFPGARAAASSRCEPSRGGDLFPHVSAAVTIPALLAQCRSIRCRLREGRAPLSRRPWRCARSRHLPSRSPGRCCRALDADPRAWPRPSKRPAAAAARAAARGRSSDSPSRPSGCSFPQPAGQGLAARAATENAEVPGAMLALGFGFTEIGTVTPQAAGRKSAAAAVPPARGPRRHRPHGLQQRRPCGRPRSRLEARREPGRHRRRQHRRRRGMRKTGSATM